MRGPARFEDRHTIFPRTGMLVLYHSAALDGVTIIARPWDDRQGLDPTASWCRTVFPAPACPCGAYRVQWGQATPGPVEADV
jgi:hypothetical protein